MCGVNWARPAAAQSTLLRTGQQRGAQREAGTPPRADHAGNALRCAGVFLGTVASLTFNGPYAMKGRQLSFDVRQMNLMLGPLAFTIPLKKDGVPIADMSAE